MPCICGRPLSCNSSRDLATAWWTARVCVPHRNVLRGCNRRHSSSTWGRGTDGAEGSETLYGVLGVTTDSDFTTIRQRYAELALRYHPDTGSSGQDVAADILLLTSECRAEALGAVLRAYTVLSDPDARKVRSFLIDLSKFALLSATRGAKGDSTSRVTQRVWAQEYDRMLRMAESDGLEEELERRLQSDKLGHRGLRRQLATVALLTSQEVRGRRQCMHHGSVAGTRRVSRSGAHCDRSQRCCGRTQRRSAQRRGRQ
jgi:hypothetical protein